MTTATMDARREPLTNLVLGDNPRRKKPDPKYLSEIAQSMRDPAIGVIEPLIVRAKGDRLQIVCGATRFLAAQEAGLTHVPVVIRDLDDLKVLEIQLIENIQRASMHPIDEGEAFRTLITAKKHTAESLASTLGKSIRWVYQRIAFAEDLVPAVKDAFGQDAITSKHAELLIRLDKKEQPQALTRGCFTRDWLGGEQKERLASTRELEEWIAENVEKPVNVEKLQQQLPDVAVAQAVAEAKGAKLLQLANSYGDYNKLDAGVLRNDQWKRAAGTQKCTLAEKGVVVLGNDIGAVFDVCIDRDCAKHWPKPAAARKETPSEKAESARNQKRHQMWAEQQARKNAKAARWTATLKRAKPAVLAAIKKVTTFPAALVRSSLAKNLPFGTGISAVQTAMGGDPLKDLAKALIVARVIAGAFSFREAEFRAIAKAVKCDLKPFEPKPAPNKPAKKPVSRRPLKMKSVAKAFAPKKRKAAKKR